MNRSDILTPDALATAIPDSLTEFWYGYADRNPQATRLRFDGAEGFSCGLPHPLFTQVLQTEPHLDQARLLTIRDRMQARRLPWLWCGQTSVSSDTLDASLHQAGMIPASTMPGMALDLIATPLNGTAPPGLEIREATDIPSLNAYADAVLPAYEMPSEFRQFFLLAHETHGAYPNFPARLFYGIFERQPVAGSLVYFGKQLASIQCVGTHPGARGKGFGSAVVCACLRAAREAGYRYAALHASEMGAPIYRRLGFQTYFEQSFFMAAPGDAKEA